MKRLLIILFLHISGLATIAQTPIKNKPSIADSIQIVEAACGQCKFGIKGEDCNLAVRIDGKTYFVDGSKIDDHGDAHANDGFCNKIRKARVSGHIVNNRCAASSFTLLPEDIVPKKN